VKTTQTHSQNTDEETWYLLFKRARLSLRGHFRLQQVPLADGKSPTALDVLN